MALWTKKKITGIVPAELEKVPLFVLLILQFNISMTFTWNLDVKNDVFAHITEPSNDDYDYDVSDNCDNNFGTFDDFGVKNDQKVSHNMILMSK